MAQHATYYLFCWVLTAVAVPIAAAQDPGAPKLSLPIACELGKTCFVQSYVDIDPGVVSTAIAYRF